MARTTIAPAVMPTGFPLTKLAQAGTAADVANGNQFVHTGKETVYVRNTAGVSGTVTFQSVAINGRQDPLHNTAITLAAAEEAYFNLRGDGWKQTADGMVYVNGSAATILITVCRQPA